MNKDITGPVDKVTNVWLGLGPRIIMAGNEVLGTADNISIKVAEATKEELEKLGSRMSNSERHKTTRRIRAKQRAKEVRLHRNSLQRWGYGRR